MSSTKKKSIHEKLAGKLSAAAQIPRDLTEGAVLVSVTGQEELYIENYKGIIEYTDARLMLQTKKCRLEIIGTDLYISYYTMDEMKVTGRIEQINYL